MRTTATEIMAQAAVSRERDRKYFADWGDRLAAAYLEPILKAMEKWYDEAVKAEMDREAQRVINERLYLGADVDDEAFWWSIGYGFIGGGGVPPSKNCAKCGTPILWHAKLCDECKVAMAPCPATHAKGASHCILCRQTPGFVEEIK